MNLLELLVERGPLDCRQMAELTGFAKPTVAATLHAALGRGMVQVVPKSQLPADHPAISRLGPRARGSVYAFQSFEPHGHSLTSHIAFEETSFPREIAILMDQTFRPSLQASIDFLNRVCERRVFQAQM
jgi:DNA-binding IclR family transcriptional regulator